MDQQRLLFDYSPFFLLLCAAAGLGYAYTLYKAAHTWSINVNRFLFGVRAILVFAVSLLLVGPIVKLTENTIEKPGWVFLMDNSASVKDGTDSLYRDKLKLDLDKDATALRGSGYDVTFRDLNDGNSSGKFTAPTSDLAGAIKSTTAAYEGKNLAGIVLISDGIYNTGLSPLYTPVRVPIYTVGLGDTSVRKDLILKNVEFNKIAYEGNKFPLRAEVIADGLLDQNISVSVLQGGKQVFRQSKNADGKNLIAFDFSLDAKEMGLQRIDVVVESNSQEKNVRNNQGTVFVDVVEGRKKILLIAPAPHPDIKALRSVVEANANYEFILHIPGVQEADPAMLLPGKADLIIFQEVADTQSKTTPLFARLSKGPSSLLMIIGSSSNTRLFQASEIPLVFDKAGQFDEVTPVINAAFRDFGFSENVNLAFSKFPPVTVPFGRFSYSPGASVLMYQRIGSVVTDRPMLLTQEENGRKVGIFIGEGLWRWRLNEFAESEHTEAFDEVFSKLIQYLSTREDKRKFKVFPVQHEFTDAEPVVFESQVYNDLFQPIYGNTINIDVRDEQGKTTAYNYVTSAGSTRYRIGGLREGVYKYTGSTLINGKREDVKGEFLVKAQNIESQNLTADFGLLRKLSASTGGRFFQAGELSSLPTALRANKAPGLIHTADSFNPLINLKWVFFILLALVSLEWFTRKYMGAY